MLHTECGYLQQCSEAVFADLSVGNSHAVRSGFGGGGEAGQQKSPGIARRRCPQSAEYCPGLSPRRSGRSGDPHATSHRPNLGPPINGPFLATCGTLPFASYAYPLHSNKEARTRWTWGMRQTEPSAEQSRPGGPPSGVRRLTHTLHSRRSRTNPPQSPW